MRFVHQTPQADRFGQTTNFFPDRWRAADAPRLYQPACAGAAPCSGADRQAQDPGTGALLGPGTDSLIGQAVPGTGVEANGILRAGEGIADAGYVWPALGVAPRIGAAYDVRGDKTLILRAAGGLFFDRPDGNTVFNSVANPPVASGLTQQWGRLSDLDASAYTLGPVPTVRVYAYDSRLPSDIQWNAGVQLALPWTSSLDVSYVGHHAFDVLGGEQATGAVDLNTIDLGTTFRADGQDPTQPAGQALPDNLLRPYRGYSNILVQWGRFHRTFHSLQSTVTRRWRGNLSAGATWVYTISDRGTTGLPGPLLRLDHADGGYVVRADQADAEALFADQGVLRHLLMANAVWAPPARWADAAPRRIAWLLRNWQVSGIFRFDTGAPYDVTYTYQTGGGSALTGSPDYQRADRDRWRRRRGLLERPVPPVRHQPLPRSAAGQRRARVGPQSPARLRRPPPRSLGAAEREGLGQEGADRPRRRVQRLRCGDLHRSPDDRRVRQPVRPDAAQPAVPAGRGDRSGACAAEQRRLRGGDERLSAAPGVVAGAAEVLTAEPRVSGPDSANAGLDAARLRPARRAVDPIAAIGSLRNRISGAAARKIASSVG